MVVVLLRNTDSENTPIADNEVPVMLPPKTGVLMLLSIRVRD